VKERKGPPTVDELNEIQRQWMALDPHAPEKEIKRVCDMMERYPRRYVSGHDGYGVAMLDGTPMSAHPVPFADALETCRKHGGRVDVAWDGKRGEWRTADSCCAKGTT